MCELHEMAYMVAFARRMAFDELERPRADLFRNSFRKNAGQVLLAEVQ
jgi:hypothetical protein